MKTEIKAWERTSQGYSCPLFSDIVTIVKDAMISLYDLTAVLQTVWSAAEGGTVPTQFPGMPLDATRLAHWYEFWITQASQTPERHPGASGLMVLVDVHCFCRGIEKRRIMTMADVVRQTFAHQIFPLSGEQIPPYLQRALRIREAVLRDLTRESNPEPKLPLQHLVVSFRGYAEEAIA